MTVIASAWHGVANSEIFGMATSGLGKRARSVVCALVGLVSLVACSGEQSAQRTLRVGHTLDVAHPVHLALAYMSEDLHERSDGQLTLALYPSGQLGSERELIELLQIGALDMTKVSASPLEGFASQMGVFGLPYLFRDNGHYWQVLNGPIGQELLGSMTDKRLVGLGYFDAGARSFYTKDAAVSTPDDVAGKKVRVMNSRMAIDTMAAMGAAATPLPGGEVYTALQQGVVDAAENNPPTYYSSRHFEVAPFYALDEHAAIPDVILLSAATHARLTEQERTWLYASMVKATSFQRELWQRATDDALAALEAEGVEIIRPDKSVFAAQVTGVYERLGDSELADLANRIRLTGEADQ